MLAPGQYVDDYYKQVKGAKNDKTSGGYVFPCKTQLPALHLGFGNYTAHISDVLLNFGPVDQNDPTGSCFGALQTLSLSGGGGPSAIFGDVFLKSTFVVFSAPADGPPTLGFAQKGDVASSSSGSSASGGWTSLMAIVRAFLGKNSKVKS